MYKLLILLAAILLLLPAAVQATPPPAFGGYLAGWGMNPNNWSSFTGSWTSGFSIYDPVPPNNGGGGNAWVVAYDGFGNPLYIDYAEITVELWIEMYAIQTYQYTSYKYHRLGNAPEDLCFTISGTLESNESQWVGLTQGTTDPNYLTWQHNIGVGQDENMRNIPIIWRGRWGTGFVNGNNIVFPWTILTWVTGDLLYPAQIPASDHWFDFQGCFSLLYHEADGYYYLDLAGCPAPGL